MNCAVCTILFNNHTEPKLEPILINSEVIVEQRGSGQVFIPSEVPSLLLGLDKAVDRALL